MCGPRRALPSPAGLTKRPGKLPRQAGVARASPADASLCQHVCARSRWSQASPDIAQGAQRLAVRQRSRIVDRLSYAANASARARQHEQYAADLRHQGENALLRDTVGK
jgi:hypothetical protein